METAYYLIVEQSLPDGGRLRTLDDYAAADLLVDDAANYEAGEFSGRCVGAVELSFDSSGLLVDARPMADLPARVHSELRGRPEWQRRQNAMARWAAE